MTGNLDPIAEELRRTLISRDEAREKLIPLCREVIRHSSVAIRAVHRREFALAGEALGQARGLLNEAWKIAGEHGDAGISGLIRDAEKEFAEASITLAIVEGRGFMPPGELGVDVISYLHGMGEAVGELRRYLLDAMRRGDLSRGEELLGVMDDIYNVLVTMDFPDGLTGGLRRTTDVARGVLENMRRDLTLAMRQKELESRLDRFEGGK
ncbi:MAG: haloacid dehalogenase [Dehalococcoidales bacterium]|nr:haloacid dehalogenase [Dehalococcoidales bacterium]